MTECKNPMCRHGQDANCKNPEHLGVFLATKKPVKINAIRWTGDNLREVIAFTGLNSSAEQWTWEEYQEVVRKKGLKIFTLEGSHMADIDDVIIKGVVGEFYPCKPDVFSMTYDISQ